MIARVGQIWVMPTTRGKRGLHPLLKVIRVNRTWATLRRCTALGTIARNAAYRTIPISVLVAPKYELVTDVLPLQDNEADPDADRAQDSKGLG